MNQPARFVALDSLRGIAALSIVAYHLHGGGALFEISLIRNAWLAVDFFFVLSGFVIAANYAERLSHGFSALRFAFLRLGRLYPLHLAVLSAYVALELAQWWFNPPGWTLREPFTGYHSLGHLLRTVLMLHGFSNEVVWSWSGQSWSISVELWLYLMTLALWKVLGRRGWMAALLLSAGAIVALGLNEVRSSGPMTYTFLRGVAGFGLGVAAWELWQRLGPGWQKTRMGGMLEWVTVAAVLAAVGLAADTDWQFAIVDPVFALAVLVFAGDAGPLARFLHRSAFQWGGRLSYSIYMVHLMVLGRGADLLRQVGLGRLGMHGSVPIRAIDAPEGVNTLLGLLLMAVSVGAAWFTWKFIEMPAREWSRRKAHAIGADR